MNNVIAVDFDGTLAEYESGDFHSGTVGKPIAGAISFLKSLRELGVETEIFSARAGTPEGKQAIVEWVNQYANGLVDDVTHIKRPSFLAIVDDRGIHFDGQNYKEILKELIKRMR